MSHEEAVRKVYPDAVSSRTRWQGGESWAIRTQPPTGHGYLGDEDPGIIGQGPTEHDAWLNAFRNLPRQPA